MHAAILAMLILLFSLKALVSGPAAGQPAWYAYAIAIGGMGCVLVGGIVRPRLGRGGRIQGEFHHPTATSVRPIA